MEQWKSEKQIDAERKEQIRDLDKFIIGFVEWRDNNKYRSDLLEPTENQGSYKTKTIKQLLDVYRNETNI